MQRFLRDKRPCGEKDGLVVVEDRQLRDTVSVQSYMNVYKRFQNIEEIHITNCCVAFSVIL